MKRDEVGRFLPMISVMTILILSGSHFLFAQKLDDFGASKKVAIESKKPKFAVPDGGDSVTLCHATGSTDNPYETITVSTNGNAHQNHPADIIPAPSTGCPGRSVGTAPTPGTAPGDVTPAPEPLTIFLFGAGVAGVGYAARRISRKNGSG